MPYITSQSRQNLNKYTLFDPTTAVEPSSFGEVFQARFGLVVDEELSISSLINRDEEVERTRRVKAMIDDGFNVAKYTQRSGRIDYDRIASDTGLIQSDEELRQLRNDRLAVRREYAQDVIERGSGIAQFAGSMTALMLDPVNIATMGLGASVSISRSLSVTANAMRVAKAEAGIAVATELAIQPLVFQHKLDIESPYSAQDALFNIAAAGAGGAVFGGVLGGISGYLRRVKDEAVKLDAAPADSPEEMALDVFDRAIDDLEYAKANGAILPVDKDEIAKSFIDESRQSLLAVAATRLTRGERKRLNIEKKDLEYKLIEVSDAPEEFFQAPGVSKRRAKKQQVLRGKKLAEQQRGEIIQRLRIVDQRLEADETARIARRELDILDSGKIPEGYQEQIDQRFIEEEINRDIEWMSERETRLDLYNQPSLNPENYVEPEPQRAAPKTSTSRQRDILDQQGIASDYDRDIEAYQNLGGTEDVRPERTRDGRRRTESRGAQTGEGEIPSRQSLEGAPEIRDATGPDEGITRSAQNYARNQGIPFSRQRQYVGVDEDRARRISDAYEEMVDDPTNPEVQAAYRDLVEQTRSQYDQLTESGYSFTFFDEKTDPYNGNPYDAIRDLRNNKRMAVYGTYDGFGSMEEFKTKLADNNRIMLEDTGLRWKDQNGQEQIVTNNDLFRAVHDAFGHSIEGAGFRARGEENAFQAHLQLFTGPARRALTTETRGQNSWLNYGPFGERNQTASVGDTVFADQKMGLLPEWVTEEGVIAEVPVRGVGLQELSETQIELRKYAAEQMLPIDREIRNVEEILRCALG